MVLLSVKARLRAAKIAKLDWSMVLDANGRIGELIEVRDGLAKKGAGPGDAIILLLDSNSAFLKHRNSLRRRCTAREQQHAISSHHSGGGGSSSGSARSLHFGRVP